MKVSRVVMGGVGLALLENVLSHPQAWGRISSGLSWLDGAEARFLDPTIPLLGPVKTASAPSVVRAAPPNTVLA